MLRSALLYSALHSASGSALCSASNPPQKHPRPRLSKSKEFCMCFDLRHTHAHAHAPRIKSAQKTWRKSPAGDSSHCPLREGNGQGRSRNFYIILPLKPSLIYPLLILYQPYSNPLQFPSTLFNNLAYTSSIYLQLIHRFIHNLSSPQPKTPYISKSIFFIINLTLKSAFSLHPTHLSPNSQSPRFTPDFMYSIIVFKPSHLIHSHIHYTSPQNPIKHPQNHLK